MEDSDQNSYRETTTWIHRGPALLCLEVKLDSKILGGKDCAISVPVNIKCPIQEWAQRRHLC
jgi:hypothetical protein